MIVRGYNKGIFELYIVKKPQSDLFSTKKDLINQKRLIKAILSLIQFLPLKLKEKSLYNITFLDNNQGSGL